MAKKKSPSVNNLQPGDPVEIIWLDACTVAAWTSPKEAKEMPLTRILTRGTLLSVDDQAIRVALDGSLNKKGELDEFHGIGVIERNSVQEICKLERTKKPRTRRS